MINKDSSVGIEIEINYIGHCDRKLIQRDMWTLKSEHCGYELCSNPASSATEIRRLLQSIKLFGENFTSLSFDNAGNHFHIDFTPNISTLTRVNCAKNSQNAYVNPIGNSKRYYWKDKNGLVWESPKSFKKYYLSRDVYANTNIDNYKHYTSLEILESVKRFFILGTRFADVLIALQSPDRRFNKYCHTIGDWDESKILSAKSISEIGENPNLQQQSRRTMFNALSYLKFGTIELRMMAATLYYKQIWVYLYLFIRMSELAKKIDMALPKSSNNITHSFDTLMVACGIRGRIRSELEKMLKYSLACTHFKCRCFNLGCEYYGPQNVFFDYGLSRALCAECTSGANYCALCGQFKNLYSLVKFDDFNGGRYLCKQCWSVRSSIEDCEQSTNVRYSAGVMVGSGFDEHGFTTLRKLREIYRGRK